MASDGDGEDLNDNLTSMISERRAKNFIPLTEDVSEWLAKIFERNINVENIMDELDNGELICELANKLQKTTMEFCRQRDKERRKIERRKPLPALHFKIHRSAKKESFQARENAANFIWYFL